MNDSDKQFTAKLNFINDKKQLSPLVENGEFGKHIIQEEYLSPHNVNIVNARLLNNVKRTNFGFELHHYNVKFNKYEDETQITTKFYDELIMMLNHYCNNFQSIIPLNYRIRNFNDNQAVHQHDRPAFELVHSDYSQESALEMAYGEHKFAMENFNNTEWLIAINKIKQGHRFELLNIWKPIEPIHYKPLAICQIQSASEKDIVKSILRRNNYDLEILTLKYNQHQKWFYFADMQPHEWLIFTAFDSTVNKINHTVFHSAFNNNCPNKNRKSIECRVLVVY